MLYSTFIYQAEENTIHQLDNGTWYLEPEWKDIICREVESDLEGLKEGFVSDWWDVENILRLEVDKRNAADNNKKAVIDWLYELITANIEPAVMAEETEFIKSVTDYMLANHKIKDELQEGES